MSEIYKNLTIFQHFLNSKRKVSKASNYFEIYDELLNKYKNKNVTLVEIGVKWGGSLEMWKNYLGPRARIIGIDLYENTKRLEKEGYEIFIGDQSSPSFWENFFDDVGTVDIIIDDGGHTNENQILTLNCCIKNINDDGILITEDVVASYSKKYNNPQKFSFINYCKHLIDDINSRVKKNEVKNLFRNKKTLNSEVYSIKFYTSCVAFFIDRKKCIESESITNMEIDLQKDIIEDNYQNPRWVDFSKNRKTILIKIASSLKKVINQTFINYISKFYYDYKKYKVNKKKNKLIKKYFN